MCWARTVLYHGDSIFVAEVRRGTDKAVALKVYGWAATSSGVKFDMTYVAPEGHRQVSRGRDTTVP
jgi:hypothetical protein